MAAINWQLIPAHYHNYIRQVPTEDLGEALQLHRQKLLSVLTQIPEEKWEYRYAPGKWSIKEMVQHIIDTERIFCYRSLAIARKDKTPLPGFDENAYAAASAADRRTKESLLAEMDLVQQGTLLLFGNLTDEMLENVGVANGNPLYAGGAGFIIVGHALHHLQILNERYLQP